MAGALEDLTALVHFLCLLYIGLGGFLAWLRPKALLVHVFFAAWGFLVLLASLPCPLTLLQDHFRHMQGLGSLPRGFNEYYIYDALIPSSLLPVVAVGAVVLLLVSYVGAYVLHRRRLRDTGAAPDATPVG